MSFTQDLTVMHTQKHTPHLQAILRCDYDRAYESIYDSSYGTGFVFYDEEEFETDDGCSIGIMPSGSFQQ